jgi:L-alanine-DL-glutamate epimerase-like enolase superfamily enzyme
VKINQVDILPLDIPYKMPFRVSYGAVVPGTFIILRIHTDEGLEGVGNSTGFAPGLGQTRESAMALMKEVASAVLIGKDPLNTDQLLNQVEGVLGDNTWLLTYFDYALYDLKGKILNAPVYQLLGGLCRDKVPLEQIVMMDDPKVQAEVATRFLNAGFKSIKMHVGPDPKLALERFKTVREAIGPEIPLAVDMAGVYSAADGLRRIEEFNQYKLNFAEDVAPPQDVDGFIAVRSKTSVPIVADRGARTTVDIRNLIQRQAADGFHCLMGKVGGIRKAVKFTTLAETADLNYQICALGTGIEHAATAHFVVSRQKGESVLDEMGLIFYLDGGTNTDEITADVTKEISGKIENGYLYPPKGPGLGVELNEKMIKEYAAPGINKILVK